MNLLFGQKPGLAKKKKKQLSTRGTPHFGAIFVWIRPPQFAAFCDRAPLWDPLHPFGVAPFQLLYARLTPDNMKIITLPCRIIIIGALEIYFCHSFNLPHVLLCPPAHRPPLLASIPVSNRRQRHHPKGIESARACAIKAKCAKKKTNKTKQNSTK